MPNDRDDRAAARAWGDYVAEEARAIRQQIKAGAYCSGCGNLAEVGQYAIVDGMAVCHACRERSA